VIRYTARIRRNSDGLIREHEDFDSPEAYPEHEHNVELIQFQWTDGNYGCDCNRALFFAYAAGEEDPDVACDEGGYSVQIVEVGGRVLYQDEDWKE
jgi:hypothetical protein